jgi:eukaryotic-like serine/threonine-protein kinase
VSREAPVGPTTNPLASRGEAVATGLRVRGRYRVVSEIGSGAFGTVCRSEDESTGHRVAIRFLPRNFANTPQASQAVLRMGRSLMAASASHQAMARVLEFGELDAGRPFTVTEFVEGRRLSELLAGHTPLEVHTALRIALELGGAVETLHNLGFVHGAITPRNVMVLEDGRVKLLDIELSGLRDAREVQGLVNVEQPAEYLAPEQIQKGPITEKTDIYAYGVVLHELLTGAPPFQGSSREAIFAKHLREAPAPIHRGRDGIPASVSRAVTLALYKQPEARPLMGDVLNLLWTGAHGPAPRRKHTAMIAGGSALALLAIGAVVWGALALRAPSGSAPTPPTVRPTVESPVPIPPSTETRRPTPPPVVAPRDTGRATAAEPPAPPARVPEATIPAVKPSTPAVAAPPAERAPATPRPPAAAPTPDVRPAPAARATAPPAAPVTPAPSVAPLAPPATPPTPAVTQPARPSAPPAPPPAPSAAAPAPAVAQPVRPSAPPARATAPDAPRAERREPSQTPSASPQSAPTTTEDSGAVIDWLLKPRSQ